MPDDNERVRKSISATLSEIEQAPSQWQQLGEVIEALEIIKRIERRLDSVRDNQPASNGYWQGIGWPT